MIGWLLTLEQGERHGEEERPGADLVLCHEPVVGARVEVAPKAVDHAEVEGGHLGVFFLKKRKRLCQMLRCMMMTMHSSN